MSVFRRAGGVVLDSTAEGDINHFLRGSSHSTLRAWSPIFISINGRLLT